MKSAMAAKHATAKKILSCPHSTFLLVMLGGLLVVIMIVAATTRLLPHSTAAEMVTPQQVYFHLHHTDDLISKP